MDEFERIKYLTDYLNQMTAKYDAGEPEISDKEWDNLYFELQSLEKKTGIVMVDSPTQIISYDVVSALSKVEHSHKMLSLAKTKDWNEFLQYFGNKDVIGMVKLDGLTCSLEYQNGILVKAETRGNGIIGEDILHNAKVIASIPNKIPFYDTLIVDGEIICTDSDFVNFSNEYANSRNFASGSIRLLDSKECAKRKLTFVVWNVIAGFDNENSFLNKLNSVEKLGFIVVPWTSSFDWDAKEFLINKAKKLGYPIDGLVGRFDDIAYGKTLGETDHHSKAAFAFKFYDETYPTTLHTIEWTMGRTGILTPVAVFEPIDIEGSTVERASLHNYSVMTQLMGKPYIGQKVEVFKANMIIPQIAEAEQADPSVENDWILTPTVCPICGHPVGIEESNTGIKNVVCGNPDCEGKLINRLDHFCGKKGLDIKGLSKSTLEKVIYWGWVSSISDLYTLKDYADEWKTKPGFGAKSVDNILSAIESSKECTLASYISAIGIPLIGSSVAKVLAQEFKTWQSFREAVEDETYHFWALDGFGIEMDAAIKNFNYKEFDAIEKLLSIKSIKIELTTNKTLEGKNIVITGKLKTYKNRNLFKQNIENHGGKVTNSISSKTFCLVNNDSTSQSSKNVSAQKLGIPIMTEEEFIKNFLLT